LSTWASNAAGQINLTQKNLQIQPTITVRPAAPPLPYSLPDLQVDAGRRLGLGPKQVLDACQSLYETHRLLTYPRSDCPYLPVGQHDQATAVLAAVATNLPSLLSVVGQADRSRRSRAWNDTKVTAHHAIIPTFVARPTAGLSPAEGGVYELVARRYVAQFFPAFEFHETTIEIAVGLDRFRAHGRETIAEGWRVLFAKLPPEQTGDDRQGAEDEDEGQALPVVRDGEALAVGEVAIGEKQTTPPRRFTEAGLIQAMTGIARFVDDPKIKEILRESDGIGTSATQAQIIETLLERRFIEKQRKQVVSTPIGRALIQALPEVATRPDMTAVWEAAMRRISEGQMPLDTFLAAVVKQLGTLVVSGRALDRADRSRAAREHRRVIRRGTEPRMGGRDPAAASQDRNGWSHLRERGRSLCPSRGRPAWRAEIDRSIASSRKPRPISSKDSATTLIATAIARRFAQLIKRTVALIVENPGRWPTKNGSHRYRLRRFPCTVAYVFEAISSRRRTDAIARAKA
jgi:DNA topoisomerase IA